MKFYSRKNIKLKTADIHLHYANNKGRGSDNVTVTFVNKETPRPTFTREYKTPTYDNKIIRQYRVSGWAGNVNISTIDIEYFGGVQEEA